MLWKRKTKNTEIKIIFNQKTQDIKLVCVPANSKPTEIIQILMFAINTVNIVLQKTLEEEAIKKGKKLKEPTYVS